MAQSNSGIGNVTPNAELVQMAMSYARSRMLCAAARLGVADALGARSAAPITWPKLVRRMSMLCIVCCVRWPPSVLWRKHIAVFSAYLAWKAAAEGCGPLGMASRRLLG